MTKQKYFLKNYKNLKTCTLMQKEVHSDHTLSFLFFPKPVHPSIFFNFFWSNYSSICFHTAYSSYQSLGRFFRTKTFWPFSPSSCHAQKLVLGPKMGVHLVGSSHIPIKSPQKGDNSKSRKNWPAPATSCSAQKSVPWLKGCVCYIFASLFFKSKQEHPWN